MNKKLNEFVNKDMSPISGDIPEYNPSQVFSTKTSDEMTPTIGQPTKYPSYYSLGYITEDESDKLQRENVISRDNVSAFDILNREEDNVELPDIYDLTNKTLVPKLHSLVLTLNADDNQIDKVAIFSEFISKVKLSGIDNKYKKQLLKKLKNIL